MTKKSVFCLGPSRDQADRIVAHLKSESFANKDISVLFPDQGATRDGAQENNARAPETAGTGAAAIGGALGWLTGIRALAIPGAGPFITAGPIVAALSGVAVGAPVGGIAGGLLALGVPRLEARRYERKIRKGSMLIALQTEDAGDRARARDIFQQAGAQDVCTTGEAEPTHGQSDNPATHPPEPVLTCTPM